MPNPSTAIAKPQRMDVRKVMTLLRSSVSSQNCSGRTPRFGERETKRQIGSDTSRDKARPPQPQSATLARPRDPHNGIPNYQAPPRERDKLGDEPSSPFRFRCERHVRCQHPFNERVARDQGGISFWLGLPTPVPRRIISQPQTQT